MSVITGDQRFKDGQYFLVMTKQVGAQEIPQELFRPAAFGGDAL
jgi:hypothetical protein